MSTDPQVSRRKVAAENRELASAARQLAEHCLATDLAVARDDFDVVCTSVETAKVLHQRMALLYRHMLAARTIPTRIVERSSL